MFKGACDKMAGKPFWTPRASKGEGQEPRVKVGHSDCSCITEIHVILGIKRKASNTKKPTATRPGFFYAHPSGSNPSGSNLGYMEYNRSLCCFSSEAIKL